MQIFIETRTINKIEIDNRLSNYNYSLKKYSIKIALLEKRLLHDTGKIKR